MTSKQRTVIWLGLIIVALNLLIKWPALKGIVFKGAGTTSAAKTPQNAGQAGGLQPNPQPNTSPTPPNSQVTLALWQQQPNSPAMTFW